MQKLIRALAAATMAFVCLPAHAWLNCSFGTVPTLNFGTIDPLSGQLPTTSATFTVSCTKGGGDIGNTANVCLYIGDGSAGNGNTYQPRRMQAAASNYAGFQINKDSNNQTFWGTYSPNGTPLRVSFPLTGRRGSATVTLYAQMVPYGGSTDLSNLVPGAYQSNYDADHTYWESTLTSWQTADDYCNPKLYSDQSGRFPFIVQATVNKQCRITETNTLDFGTVNDLSAAAAQQVSTLKVQCTNQTPYRIGLDNGKQPLSGQRRMVMSTNPAEFVSYDLYRDAARTQRWGNTASIDTQPGTGSGQAQSYTIYGKVLAPQNPMAGTYNDTIQVLVTY